MRSSRRVQLQHLHQQQHIHIAIININPEIVNKAIPIFVDCDGPGSNCVGTQTPGDSTYIEYEVPICNDLSESDAYVQVWKSYARKLHWNEEYDSHGFVCDVIFMSVCVCSPYFAEHRSGYLGLHPSSIYSIPANASNVTRNELPHIINAVIGFILNDLCNVKNGSCNSFIVAIVCWRCECTYNYICNRTICACKDIVQRQ
jgi:hypothetical protein